MPYFGWAKRWWAWWFTETEEQKAQRLEREKRCPAVSGVLSGYQCSLDKGHELPHKAKYSLTRDGSGREIGSKTVTWPQE